MDYSLIDFLELLGSLGIFIYGMKMMSEATIPTEHASAGNQ